MKKSLLISLLLMLGLALTACGGAANQPAAASPQLDASYENALPVNMQLLIGTFNLVGTDQAINAEQAADLLPLWQVLKDLNGNDAAAQAEIDALVEQIIETMTPEQIQAVKEMQLTPQDLFATVQEQDLAGESEQMFFMGEAPMMDGEDGQAGSNIPVPPPGAGDVVFFNSEGSEGPGGGGPGMGLNPEQIATAQAARGSGDAINRMPTMMIEALIEHLQKIANAS